MSDFNPSTSDFASMLEASLEKNSMDEGSVVTGRVTGIEKDMVIVDVGLKTEGRIPLREFYVPGSDEQVKVGDDVDIYLERIENALGDAVFSREKARREESWIKIAKVFEKEEPVPGTIVGRVKGGFTVDLGSINAFLPGSQVDIRPVRDIAPLMGQEQPFMILKMDRSRGNIVVSRRAILEESRAEQRAELVGQLAEGEVREGVVKNITDYGAFVDLGGIDGLLHVTDMTWRRISHPSQVLTVGDTVKVKIVRINPETQRISLGMKQLQEDLKQTQGNPWDDFQDRYPVGTIIKGEVRSVTEFGLFIGLDGDIDGMAHLSDLSWDKSGEDALKDYRKGDEVEAKILEVDIEKERISLGVKQLIKDNTPAGAGRGATVTCTVTEVNQGGLAVKFGEDGEEAKGFIRKGDLSRERSEQRPERFAVGDKIDAQVIRHEKNKGEYTLSVKALEIKEEKEAVQQYGSTDSGASLGDILGAALKK